MPFSQGHSIQAFSPARLWLDFSLAVTERDSAINFGQLVVGQETSDLDARDPSLGE